MHQLLLISCRYRTYTSCCLPNTSELPSTGVYAHHRVDRKVSIHQCVTEPLCAIDPAHTQVFDKEARANLPRHRGSLIARVSNDAYTTRKFAVPQLLAPCASIGAASPLHRASACPHRPWGTLSHLVSTPAGGLRRRCSRHAGHSVAELEHASCLETRADDSTPDHCRQRRGARRVHKGDTR